VTSSRHETVIAVISLDIRDSFTIDRQIDGDFISKVRGSLHDQASTFVAGARLGFRAADKEGASENNNQKEPTGGVMP
jgi:hypothetical protein